MYAFTLVSSSKLLISSSTNSCLPPSNQPCIKNETINQTASFTRIYIYSAKMRMMFDRFFFIQIETKDSIDA